jgi:uncharacterized protein (DUF1501 family)
VTGSLVPLARVENPGTLAKIKAPNVIDPNNPDSATYHTADTMNRIFAAQGARLAALQGRENLPVTRHAIEELLRARIGVGDLERLTLPPTLVELEGGGLDDLERMERQAQLALAGFQSGVAVSATINLGGFDTHANHDRDQARQITKLLAGIDFLISGAELAGIMDRMYIVVGSDFGRGPLYNSDRDNAGKDHWPITSMLVMGPGIPGDRVIGATDGGQRALAIDASSLAVAGDGGSPLVPETVHRALRRVAGIDGIAADYPLAGQDIALFG